MKTAEHGGHLEKQPKKRKRSTKRRSKPAKKNPAINLLPAPVDVPLETAPNAESSAEPKNESLLESLSGMFQRPSPTIQSESPKASGTESETHGDPLTPEQQAQLNAVPDTIGDDVPTIEDGSSAVSGPADSVLSGLDIAFSEQDVTDTLTELFGWLADKFDSEHWKLTERQQRMLGGPTTQIVNATWTKLKTKLPDILARWCESTPGGTAFIMAFSIVVVPKAMKQVKLSREKRTVRVEGKTATEEKPAPRRSPQPAPTGAGIPAASGIIGGD